MLFRAFHLVAALAATLSTLVAASPAPRASSAGLFTEQMEHIKRELVPRDGTETLYLVNGVEGGSGLDSFMVYYPPGANSQGGQEPPDPGNDLCEFLGIITWEGITQSCTFPSGVTATSVIGPGSHDTFSQSGSATNGFRDFECFRDNNRVLFDSRGVDFESIYFCI